jgi:probable F420-dependent oxidoreductase
MSTPFRFGCLAMTPVQDRAQWLDQARAAEANGFGTLQVTDHFVRTPLAPMLALAAAAQVTSTITLGTLVLDNDFRHPAMLAKEVATLDLLCDGRLELGLGAGWLAEDYEISGIAFDSPGKRITRLAETVKRLVEQPHPPLLLGGGGPRMLTLAAQQADIVGVNLMNAEGFTGAKAGASAYAEATDAKVQLIRAASAHRGTDLPLHVIAYWTEVTENPREAIERKIAQLGIPVTPDELASSPHCLIGPLAYLQERLIEQRERWGFSYVTFYQRDAVNCAELVTSMSGR